MGKGVKYYQGLLCCWRRTVIRYGRLMRLATDYKVTRGMTLVPGIGLCSGLCVFVQRDYKGIIRRVGGEREGDKGRKGKS